MRLGLYLREHPGAYDCTSCTERERDKRNCRNRKRAKQTLLHGRAEFLTSTARHVLKVDDLKFMACPASTITARTWKVLRLVNECLSPEGALLQLPFPGALTDQPEWFRAAVQIVRAERSRHQMEKMKHGR